MEMDNVKKKEHDVIIKGIVIHKVIKDAHKISCSLKLAEKLISPKEREIAFVANVKDAYYKKLSPTYGIFGEGDAKFKELLIKYSNNEISFLDFSKKGTEYYKTIISRVSPATGGYIIYIHYINVNKKQECLLVLTANNKDGFVIDDNLNIKDIKNLDLTKIDVACLINITKWKNITNKQDNNSKTYLSFIRGNKDVSLYFMAFINCNDNTTSTESTKRLVQTLDAYCKSKKYDRDVAIQKKNAVFEYCTQCITNKKEIQLSAISALLDNEHPDEFKEYAAQEDNGVNEIISGDKTQLRKMRYTYYRSDNLTIIFDNNELDKTVFYNKQTKQLIFKKLPEKLIKELEK